MGDILDDLLEQNLTEIAKLPVYEIPPNGVYKLSVEKVERKVVTLGTGNPAPVIDFQYKVLGVVELSDPTKLEQVTEGQMFNETYFFHTDPKKTQEVLNANLEEVAATFSCKNLKETLEKFEGLEIYASVKQRKDKNDETKVYGSVRNIKVA